MITKEYPYLYETHLHTMHGSKCGKNSGREMVDAANAAGYTGIFITEHNWGGNTIVDKKLPWEQWVAAFIQGYYETRDYGDSVGIDVFWGYEAGFCGTEFLIYGFDPHWLFQHPQLRELPLKEHLALVRAEGGMVIHAHPFRTASYIPSIQLLIITDEKKREECYKETMRTCDCREFVSIIKTIYTRKQERLAEGKKVTASDEKYFSMAEDKLYGELAIALEMEKNKVKRLLFVAREKVKLTRFKYR